MLALNRTNSIPAGSFTTTAYGSLTYSGQNVSIRLRPNGSSYTFNVAATGVDVATIVNPATLQLVVGNNTGSASSVKVKRKFDD